MALGYHIFGQVGNRGSQQVFAVLKLAKGLIAVAAQKPAYRPSLMIMINSKCLDLASALLPLRPTTDVALVVAVHCHQ